MPPRDSSPDGTSRPFSVVISSAGTPHAAAAAWTSIQRAAAPVRRMPSTPVARTDRLPPVICAFRNSAVLRMAKSALPESAAGMS